MDVGRTAAAMTNAYQSQQTGGTKENGRTRDARETKTQETAKVLKNNGVSNSEAYGKTIGEPQLSEKAAKYYESLKGKFGDMDFILVANDSIEGAEQKAAMMGSGKTLVLIDAEKIERMAEDEDYRKKYEGIITMAQKELPELAKQMSGMKSIQGFGMRVNDDGTTSFFAVSKKNNDAINEKMAQKRADKKAQAKKDAKKAEKKEKEEKLKEKREAGRAKGKDRLDKKDTDRFGRKDADRFDGKDADPFGRKDMDRLGGKDMDRLGKPDKGSRTESFNPDNFEVFEADSIEGLLKLVQDHEYNFRSDNVISPMESLLGGNFDFSL